MNRYQKMCVAAGLNYYRKLPNLVDLQRLSGFSISEFFSRYKIYEFSSNLACKLLGTENNFTVEESALQMVMKEKWNFIWAGDKWITEAEGCEIIKDFDPKELVNMFKRGV